MPMRSNLVSLFFVIHGVSALLGHHQGTSIVTFRHQTNQLSSSFHVFFCLFNLIPTAETFVSNFSRAFPSYHCIPSGPDSLLPAFAEQKGKDNSKESWCSVSVVHINTCWLTNLLTLGGGHFDPKTPFVAKHVTWRWRGISSELILSGWIVRKRSEFLSNSACFCTQTVEIVPRWAAHAWSHAWFLTDLDMVFDRFGDGFMDRLIYLDMVLCREMCMYRYV